MSNSLDPDQARQNVGPDLGPNWLQKFAADGISRWVKHALLQSSSSPTRLIFGPRLHLPPSFASASNKGPETAHPRRLTRAFGACQCNKFWLKSPSFYLQIQQLIQITISHVWSRSLSCLSSNPDMTSHLFTLCMLGNFARSQTICWFFFKIDFFQKNSGITPDSLDREQAWSLSGLIWV